MITALFLMLSVAFGQTCEDPKSLPESLQVAWISPASKTVGMNGWIEAVRVSDLRAWVRGLLFRRKSRSVGQAARGSLPDRGRD